MPQSLAKNSASSVVAFQPSQAKMRDAQANAVVEYAKQVRDWPMLEAAIAQKLEDQWAFVAWWDGAVRDGGRPKETSTERNWLSQSQAEKQTGISHVQVSRWRARLEEPERYKAMLYGKAWAQAMAASQQNSQLVQQSLSNEHYTPDVYLTAARAVLGAIDLDPASCEEANAKVGADRYYSEQDNGLELEWSGRIWLNPPYGGSAGEFITKLSLEYQAGNVSAAIALVNAHCTDTSWFQLLWDGVLCFTNHRINFYGDTARSGSTHGSVFVYLGPDRNSFVSNFRQFGACVERV